MDDFDAQQIKMSATKHLAFQKFEAIDMSFCDAIALRPRESSVHGSIIPRNAIGEPDQFGDPRRFGTPQPVVDLGKKQWALMTSREVGNDSTENVMQWNIGALTLGQHYYDLALAAFLLARQCFVEISSPRQNEVEGWIDYLRQTISQEQLITLRARVEQEFYNWKAQYKEE